MALLKASSASFLVVILFASTNILSGCSSTSCSVTGWVSGFSCQAVSATLAQPDRSGISVDLFVEWIGCQGDMVFGTAILALVWGGPFRQPSSFARHINDLSGGTGWVAQLSATTFAHLCSCRERMTSSRLASYLFLALLTRHVSVSIVIETTRPTLPVPVMLVGILRATYGTLHHL
jgi:hypothetical protein